MEACIGYPEEDDEYLTKNSVQFHEHMGFRLAGEFHDSGYKFGRWYNVVWMEKMIGDHPENPSLSGYFRKSVRNLQGISWKARKEGRGHYESDRGIKKDIV